MFEISQRPINEMKIAEASVVTAYPSSTLKDDFKLNGNLKGLKILDLGTGASTSAIDLNAKGAKAWGFDIRYQNFDDLRARSSNLLSKNESCAKFMGKTQKRFFNEYRMRNRPYIAGLATELPFLADTFDLCLSFEFHGSVLIKDYEVLKKSVDETLRVLKPGGRFLVFPWFQPPWTELMRNNAYLLGDYLKVNDINYQIKGSSTYTTSVLEVTKS